MCKNIYEAHCRLVRERLAMDEDDREDEDVDEDEDGNDWGMASWKAHSSCHDGDRPEPLWAYAEGAV